MELENPIEIASHDHLQMCRFACTEIMHSEQVSKGKEAYEVGFRGWVEGWSGGVGSNNSDPWGGTPCMHRRPHHIMYVFRIYVRNEFAALDVHVIVQQVDSL